jgi:hypothetical protein
VHAPVKLEDMGKLVAFFRAPGARLTSCFHNTFNVLSGQKHCDLQTKESTIDSLEFSFLHTHGWDPSDVVRAWVEHNCSIPWGHLRSATVLNRMLGVQSKLVLGLQAGTPVYSSEFHSRWSRLADSTNAYFLRYYAGLRLFAFVGVTEQWVESICLFHRLFGGPVLPQEVLNSRATPDKPLIDGAQLRRFVESQMPDPYDTFLYSKVLARFHRDMEQHRIPPSSEYRRRL